MPPHGAHLACRPRIDASMATEFDIISRYFSGTTTGRRDVSAGIGDDAALVIPAAGREIVSVCTALHEGLDFAPDTPPAALGRQAVDDGLRVLARGFPNETPSEPAWALLGLTLPSPDEEWMREFAAAFAGACRAAGVELVGGDTTRGPRSVVCVLHALRHRDL